MRNFKFTVCLILWISLGDLNAQLTINNAVNATDGVQNILLGAGISVSNISSPVGTNNQVAQFTCTDCNVGISSGLILSGGNADVASGPNANGGSSTTESGFGASDPDLSALGGGSLNDCVVIEFDFVPTGDSLAFKYVFGSEEYSEWLGYGDIFGFFLSGPGISGPYTNGAINIAVLPGTSIPVKVPNVNNGGNNTGPCQNCGYFNWNGYGSDGPYNSDDYYIEYDGFTTVLTASAIVQCGETYHIKLAVADQYDTAMDSGVFLEAGSFQSNQVAVAYTPPTISPDNNSLYEGCETAMLTFTLPGVQSADQTYAVDVTGTATNGVDYSLIPNELIFTAGQTILSIPVTALEDGVTEGNESITVTVTGSAVCTTVESNSYTFNIADVIPLSVTISNESIDCDETVTLAPQISGGFGYYEVQWNTGFNGPALTIDPDAPTTYSFVVTDTCGVNPFNQSVDVAFNSYPALSVDLGPDQQFTCLDDIIITPNVVGGYGAFQYDWELNGISISSDPVLQYSTSAEGTFSLTVTDVCGEADNDALDFTFPAVPLNVNLGGDFDVTCVELNNIIPQVTGGVGAYQYQWLVNGQNEGTNPTISFQADGETTVELYVEDECGNSNTDELVISVPPVAVNLELGNDLTVNCLDESLLVPNVSGGVGVYSYSWSTQNGIVSNDPTLEYQTDEDVVLSLEVEDQCGNSASDFISIAVPQVAVLLDLGADLTVTCLDNNIINPDLNGGVGNFSYSWQMNGQVVGVTSTYNLQTESDTQLTLYVEDQCGNAAMDQLLVDVPPIPVSVDIGSDLIVTCVETSFMNSLVEGGIGNYTYEWNDGNGILSNSSTAEYQTSENSAITLSVTDECGNSSSDQLLISVPPVPIVLQLSNDTAICVGQGVTLNALADGGVGTLDYDWSPYISNFESINVAPGESSIYTVNIVDECGNTAQGSITVGVEEVTPSFSAAYEGDWGVQLQNQTADAVSLIWLFPDSTMSFEENPYHAFSDMQAWEVTLIAIGELGCTKEITEIFYPIADIYVPNSFTPDGDGINDYFRAYGHDLLTFEMWIFNRWGEQVFYTDNIEKVWMGENNSGNHFVQNEVYTLALKAEGLRGNLITKTGSVTIIR